MANSGAETLNFITSALEQRKKAGNFRELKDFQGLHDFSSNDYLGLSRNRDVQKRIHSAAENLPLGATGSRLITGNSTLYDELESELSDHFKGPSALLFNSGYHANQTLLASVPQRGHVVLYDQLAHVCIKDGARLSKADSFSFAHNDPADLRRRLEKMHDKTVFVVTESVFSMDGNVAPLQEIMGICKHFGAHLIVDEAHSTGLYGGAGWLVEAGLQDDVFARVYTFGKAIGVHGACVVGPVFLRDHLVNFGHAFIYTTALPPHSLVSIRECFRYIRDHPRLQTDLSDNITMFITEMKHAKIEVHSVNHIQPVLISGNDMCRSVSSSLMEEGFDVRAILAPTVPKGSERLRVCLHAFNARDEIAALVRSLKKLLNP